jgi:polyvinyl alcohol dehydrogenase (cytochrome)
VSVESLSAPGVLEGRLASYATLVDPDWRMPSHDVFASSYSPLEVVLNGASVGATSPRKFGEIFSFSVRRADPVDAFLGKKKLDGTKATAADVGKPVMPVGAVHASAAVVGGVSYVGDFEGLFYAIDASGNELWQFRADAPNPVLGALLQGGGDPTNGPQASAPFFGGAVAPRKNALIIAADADGNVYALDRATGALVWKRAKADIDTNPLGGVSGNALLLINDDTVIVPRSSVENYALLLNQAGLPIGCCSHQGGLVALDSATGAIKWTWDAVQPGALPPAFAPFTTGPSGSDIWDQPTYDPETDTLYVGTGQSFSPTLAGTDAPTADALVALDASSGTVKWVHQYNAADIWVTGIPNPSPSGKYLDQDFGDSPHIFRLANGRKVVGAGEKSGAFHVVDAADGTSVEDVQVVQQSGPLGGLQTGGAVTPFGIFEHGLDRNAANEQACVAQCLATTAGAAQATCVSNCYSGVLDTGTIAALGFDGSPLWTNPVALPFGLTVAPLGAGADVLYAMVPVTENPPSVISPASAPQSSLLAIEALTGQVINAVPIAGRSVAGPVVSRGRVYVGFGNRAVVEIGPAYKGGLKAYGLTQ